MSEAEGSEVKNKAVARAEHPIAEAIAKFLHRTLDTELCVRTLIPEAERSERRDLEEIHKTLVESKELLSSDRRTKLVVVKKLLDILARFNHLVRSRVPEVLKSSLFVSLFSNYDAFTGELVSALYGRKPELFKRISRSMTVAEILQYDTFDDMKSIVLHNEIDAFRRKSYVEQFEQLEATFGLRLKAFERWAEFVECGQRRNLFAHCDGIVSDQYLSACKKEGFNLPDSIKVGDRLTLEIGYLVGCCALMMEIGLKLGQTLWRKVLPDELEDADRYLNRTIYDFLELENWAMGQRLGQFAYCLPNMLKDVDKKVALVNYVIALKFGGAKEETEKVLDTVDWSAAANDFKLAAAVLRDNYEEAAEIMKKIGKRGDLVDEQSYYAWPLFRDFRLSEEFLRSYEAIYGVPFSVKLQRDAEAAKAETQEALGAEGANEADEGPRSGELKGGVE